MAFAFYSLLKYKTQKKKTNAYNHKTFRISKATHYYYFQLLLWGISQKFSIYFCVEN